MTALPTPQLTTLNAPEHLQYALSSPNSQDVRATTPLTPTSFVSTQSEEPVLSPGAAKMFEALVSDTNPVSDLEIKEHRKRMKEARHLSVAIPPPLPANAILRTPTATTPRDHSADGNETRPSSSRSSTHNTRTSSRPSTPSRRSHSLRSLNGKGRSTVSLRPSTPKEPLPSMEHLPYPQLARQRSGTSQPSSSSRQLSPTESKAERPDKEEKLTKKVKRRISMLMVAQPKLPEDEGYASSSTQSIPGRRAHAAKKSLSLWPTDVAALTRLNSVKSLDSHAQYQDRYQSNFADFPEPVQRMTEQQRIEHLRRTRKLMQVFGHEPPAELLQTHHGNRNHQLNRRDSLSTLASLSSANLLSTIPAASSNDPRTSGGSRPSQSEEDDESGVRPKPPAPFADLIPEDPQAEARPPTQSAAFYERRKRVAKLSRFFGVAAHDIIETVPLAASSHQTSHFTPVDVKIIDKGHFWSSGDQWKEGKDLDDLRHRLRDLRAT